MIQKNINPLPDEFYTLFWDYNPESIDVVLHKDKELIMGRLAERGSWDSMKWLLETYSKAEIISFLYNKGKHTLPFRELNYWLLMMDVPSKKRGQILSEARESNNVWKNRCSH